MKRVWWEVILVKEGKGFKREVLEETTEVRARAEARKRFCYAGSGCSIYNVSQVKIIGVK